MKKVLMTVLAVLYVAIMTGFFYMLMSDDHHFLPEKPVLYLYPQEEWQLTVTLDLEGTSTPCTRPRTSNARPNEGPRPRGP